MSRSSNQYGSDVDRWALSRREILTRSGLAVAGLATGACTNTSLQARASSILTFGMVTDLHYADADARGNRYYRQSTTKMDECVRFMNQQQVDFMIELGDFKDQTEAASEAQALQDLSDIESVYTRFKGPRYHVLGNHDMDCISKRQFLSRIQNHGIAPDASYYSFDRGDIHFVVLDANYTSGGKDYDHNNFEWNDANIPKVEREWLADDLASSAYPAVIFVHQQLDDNGGYSVRKAARVRRVLEKSRKVLAVFQGHHHQGFYTRIEGIHYYTLRAAVDGSGGQNNAYALVEVLQDGNLVVTGYRKALSATLNPG